MTKARAIHQRVMTLDTHVDINPNQFNPNDTANFAKGVPGRQVDLPKMEAGGYDAVFLAVYQGQGPLDSTRIRERVPRRDRQIRRDPSPHRSARA